MQRNIALLSLLFLLLNFNAKQKSVFVGNSSSFQDTHVLNPQYYLLQNAMFRYEAIRARGGWDTLPTDTNVWKSGHNSISVLLKNRLEKEGYLEKKINYRSEDLNKGLKLFQLNNGLLASGELDALTIKTLNISVEQRIMQLKINSLRWIDEPVNMGKHYLFVNAADFNLKVVKNDTVKMQMKIIVGKTYRPTPVFHARLTHIIFNPTWNIPPTILKNDILPILRKNSAYLRKKHIRVFMTTKDGKRYQVSDNSINWKKVSAENFPYELIEDPGPENPLGVVKFMFPNSHNVYMHDTPTKDLFKETNLTFSSGCIRLSKALDLANYLLKNSKGWDEMKISKTIGGKETVTVILPEPLDVYIEYFTAWVDDNGAVQFRKDIYNRDVECE